MRGLTPKKITELCDGVFVGNTNNIDTEISFITRDSREAGKNCLYAAIIGERVDGHDFLDKCHEAGAICAICEKDVGDVDIPYIIVESTQTALGKIAKFYRSQFDIPVIGITGSVGKTSAKEMIASVLAEKYNTLKTQGNYNNELGVPLTLFGLKDEHEVAVIEMGISDFHEMSRLTDIVQPEMALITTIGHSHLEKLIDLDGVLRAKMEICEGMSDNSLLILCGDDEKLVTAKAVQNKLYFGTCDKCEIMAKNLVTSGADAMECDIEFANHSIHIKINSFGEHMVYAALAAVAVAQKLGLTDTQIIEGIAKYEPVGRRAKAVSTGFCTVIDDCYNANPNSMKSALKSLKLLSGRRVCILGDMLELGENSAQLHSEIGEIASDCADLVITFGDMAKHISDSANKSIHFENKADLLEKIPNIAQKDDSILIKASRGMKFEEISEKLMTVTL